MAQQDPFRPAGDESRLDPMLSDGSGADADFGGNEAALSGAVLPPIDVRIEIDDIRDEEPRIRRLGARALIKRRQRYPQVVAAFRSALTDGDPEVRGLAAQGLADLDVGDAVPAVRKLLSDPASWVRVQAAEALSKLGDTACLGQILDFLQDVPGWVKRLVGSGKPEVLPTLARALEIGKPAVRGDITASLRRLGIFLEPAPAPACGWRWRFVRDPDWRPVR